MSCPRTWVVPLTQKLLKSSNCSLLKRTMEGGNVAAKFVNKKFLKKVLEFVTHRHELHCLFGQGFFYSLSCLFVSVHIWHIAIITPTVSIHVHAYLFVPSSSSSYCYIQLMVLLLFFPNIQQTTWELLECDSLFLSWCYWLAHHQENAASTRNRA